MKINKKQIKAINDIAYRFRDLSSRKNIDEKSLNLVVAFTLTNMKCLAPSIMENGFQWKRVQKNSNFPENEDFIVAQKGKEEFELYIFRKSEKRNKYENQITGTSLCKEQVYVFFDLWARAGLGTD